jgi:hypothetical protein
MNISARFTQGPIENKRYLLDYSLQLALGEMIVSVVALSITSPTDLTNAGGFQITSIAIAPTPSLQAAYFASCANLTLADGQQYLVQFKATTSLGQILEDVVVYQVREKLDL